MRCCLGPDEEAKNFFLPAPAKNPAAGPYPSRTARRYCPGASPAAAQNRRLKAATTSATFPRPATATVFLERNAQAACRLD